MRRELLGDDEVVGENCQSCDDEDDLEGSHLPLAGSEVVADDRWMLHIGSPVDDG